MRTRSVAVLVACLAALGCDRAKNFLGQARGAGGAGLGEVAPGGEVDRGLAGMVSRRSGGVSFRRDLPFPSRVESWMKVRLDHRDVQVVEASGPETQTRSKASYAVETVTLCRKHPGSFELSLLKAARRQVADPGKSKTQDWQPGHSADLEDQTIGFVLAEHGWRPRQESGPVDFKRAVWSEALKECVPQLMIESGAHPRVLWFSRERVWKPGDQLDLKGKALKILEPSDVSGLVHLRFAGEEAIDGHPCGVFSVTGRMNVEGLVQPDGTRQDCDITIDSGKIWASLLHPVILREEYETVQTCTEEGGRGGGKRNLQGAIKVTKVRSWKAGD